MSPIDQTSIRWRDHDFALESAPCDYCDSKETSLLHAEMRHGLNLHSVLCTNCGLCRTNPRPTAQALADFYGRFYHEFHGRTGADAAYLAKSVKMARPRVDLLVRWISPEDDVRILEVGAGAGQFLAQAKDRTKWKCRGVEPGPDSARLSREFGVEIIDCFFDDFQDIAGSYDAVVSFHALEHTANPFAVVKKMNSLIRWGGTLYLEVPNLARPGGRLTDFLQFPHLFSFTPITLRNILISAGFTPFWVGDHVANLTFLARKTGDPIEGVATDFERFDIPEFVDRLRLNQSLMSFRRLIPPGPLREYRRALRGL